MRTDCRQLYLSRMGEPVSDSEKLEALRRLDDVLDELEKLVRKCASEEGITRDDEALHSKLVGEAQVLHGRLSGLLGRIFVVRYQGTRREDAFQSVLGNASISGLFNPVPVADFWLISLNASRSIVRQTIGKVEEMERRGRLDLSAEVVANYRGLIVFLERVRGLATRAFKLVSRSLSFLDPALRWLERWPILRLILVIGGVVGGIGTIIAIFR